MKHLRLPASAQRPLPKRANDHRLRVTPPNPCLPCPPRGFQTVLWKTSRDPTTVCLAYSTPSWGSPDAFLSSAFERRWVGRRSDLIPALGSTVCVCPSRGSLAPKPFERVWYNSCKPNCLGLNFQLHHLLAV